MALDKWIALVFLLFSLIYGYASYTYQLLPFERHMAFLPNTLPMVLSVLGVILALIILIASKPVNGDHGEKLSSKICYQSHRAKAGRGR